MDPADIGALVGIGGGIIGVIIAIVATVCSLALPVVIFGAIGWWILNSKKKKDAAIAASLNWSSTKGKVLKSFVEISGHDYVSHYPAVIYEYEVGGQRYQGNRFRAGDQHMRVSSGSHMQAMEVVMRYPEGSEVTVCYNPANPVEAALERQ